MNGQPKIVVAADYELKRLMLTGPLWADMDLQFCAHGEKLRWTCDECDEWFEATGKRRESNTE